MKCDERFQSLQRRHTASMRAIRRKMASYSDTRLRELAVDPKEREAMQQVLTDCQAAIRRSNSTLAKAALSVQVRRLQKALNNPAVAA